MEVRIQVNTAPTFASAGEALGMLKSAMGYLSAADPTQMPTGVQAQCLQVLEQVDAIGTAARACILGAFTAARGYCEDADYSPRTWLVNKTRVTGGSAYGHVAWARRVSGHPRVAAALAAAEISASFGRAICEWTDKLPEDCRDAADQILIDAVRSGLSFEDLIKLAAEMYEVYEKSQPSPAGQDHPEQTFKDRSVRLETTIGGAGVLSGDLTPECAAFVTTVLDALSAPAGAEDTRSHQERYHDALEEAMRRLVAADLLPERAGQPAKVWAHISLADLIVLDADSALLAEWSARVRREWAAARAAASAGGSDGAAWLEGDAAEGFACDASVTPVVTGNVNPAALDGLVRLCVELAGHGHDRCGADTGIDRGGDEAAPENGAGGLTGTSLTGTSITGTRIGPQPPTERGREALEQAIIGKAVELLSGPGGLAGFLRQRQLGARLGGPSLPLDVGFSDDVPASIRNAVRLRDQHCRWAGRCDQPAAACHVHHLKHKARGGKTSLTECILLCPFHHLVMVHRMGWTLILNPDGTTTAWNRDRTKVLHSHSPPARTG
jgi:hypothetical protein